MALSSTRFFPVKARDLGLVGQDVMDHFRSQEYDVTGSRTASGGFKVSLSKSDLFRTISGLRTALNVEIEPESAGTRVTAKVGLFETQAVASVITYFVFPPLLLAQVWGLAHQSKLDDEAILAAEKSLLTRYSPTGSTSSASPRPAATRFCARCGLQVPSTARFCSDCGNPIGGLPG